MSNHSGSYMLNSVLCVAKDMGIFETIGKEKTLGFARELLKLGSKYDCNDGEILEDMDELGICYCCLKETDDLEDGLCNECRD